MQGLWRDSSVVFCLCLVKTSMQGKGRGMREENSKNKLSHKPSCALITLEAITA